MGWYNLSFTDLLHPCPKIAEKEHLVFLAFSNEDTGHQHLYIEDTTDTRTKSIHCVLSSFVLLSSQYVMLLYNTSLMLTQLMFNINKQTRQHTFSTDGIYLHQLVMNHVVQLFYSGSYPKMINGVLQCEC
jgi:hypothetical protein